ncbi:hypothetical protein [Pseudoalteromonas spongiae]|uniref:hypothetical protein n=1 Tax=Pseudoalteromonas spongiae TaxID=298657 RepID=UPI000C2CFFF9|nr:hypothetical protein [Pseudoalteromonas spongiae]
MPSFLDNAPEFMKKIFEKDFRFWCCSNKEHREVEWIESKTQVQAQCKECGEKSPIFNKNS